MIQWGPVLFNGLWILGFSILLAALSFQRSKALKEKKRLKDLFNTKGFQRLFSLGMTFVCAGIGLTSETIWERALWGILFFWFIAKIVCPRKALKPRVSKNFIIKN